MSYAFLQQGAKGLVMGQNIYEHPNLMLVTRAFMALIHNDATLEEAWDICLGMGGEILII